MTEAGTFGSYRLLERLPSEGTGTLYRAHDRFRDRTVALRIFEPSAATPDWRRRTWDALHATPDPAWAAVHTHGRLGGRTFLDSVWRSERTLADTLAGISMAADAAVSLLEHVAAAIDRAHALGVAHGCIVPRHVRLTPGGVLLTDFAVAACAPDRDQDLDALARLYAVCTGDAGTSGPLPRDSAAAVVAALRQTGSGPTRAQANWWTTADPASASIPTQAAAPTPIRNPLPATGPAGGTVAPPDSTASRSRR